MPNLTFEALCLFSNNWYPLQDSTHFSHVILVSASSCLTSPRSFSMILICAWVSIAESVNLETSFVLAHSFLSKSHFICVYFLSKSLAFPCKCTFVSLMRAKDSLQEFEQSFVKDSFDTCDKADFEVHPSNAIKAKFFLPLSGSPQLMSNILLFASGLHSVVSKGRLHQSTYPEVNRLC